jgi:hypothetical protein
MKIISDACGCYPKFLMKTFLILHLAAKLIAASAVGRPTSRAREEVGNICTLDPEQRAEIIPSSVDASFHHLFSALIIPGEFKWLNDPFRFDENVNEVFPLFRKSDLEIVVFDPATGKRKPINIEKQAKLIQPKSRDSKAFLFRTGMSSHFVEREEILSSQLIVSFKLDAIEDKVFQSLPFNLLSTIGDAGRTEYYRALFFSHFTDYFLDYYFVQKSHWKNKEKPWEVAAKEGIIALNSALLDTVDREGAKVFERLRKPEDWPAPSSPVFREKVQKMADDLSSLTELEMRENETEEKMLDRIRKDARKCFIDHFNEIFKEETKGIDMKALKNYDDILVSPFNYQRGKAQMSFILGINILRKILLHLDPGRKAIELEATAGSSKKEVIKGMYDEIMLIGFKRRGAQKGVNNYARVLRIVMGFREGEVVERMKFKTERLYYSDARGRKTSVDSSCVPYDIGHIIWDSKEHDKLFLLVQVEYIQRIPNSSFLHFSAQTKGGGRLELKIAKRIQEPSARRGQSPVVFVDVYY